MPSQQRTLTRRRLLAATAATPWLGFPALRAVRGAEPAAAAETLAQTLHASLTTAQREAVCPSVTDAARAEAAAKAREIATHGLGGEDITW